MSAYETLGRIEVAPNPIFEPRTMSAWPMAPAHAAVAAIVHAHAARIWGPIPNAGPVSWSQWFGDPHAEVRAELARYAPDAADVTLAGIRALVTP